MDVRPRIALVFQRYIGYADRAVAGVVSYPEAHRKFEFREFPESPDARPIRFPRSWRPDGVIAGIGREPKVLASLLALGVPVVNLSNDWPPEVMPSVPHDLGSMAALAAEHFAARGMRRAVLVRLAGVDPAARLELLAEPFRRRGLDVRLASLPRPPAFHGRPPLEEREAPEELTFLLRTLPRPVGLWACDDVVGEYLCRVCRHLAVRVPEDVAVLGVSDTSVCRTCDPPLSSIRLPNEEQGFRAMGLMERLLAGEAPPAGPLRVPVTELVARQSSVGDDRLDDDLDRAVAYIREHACEGLTVGEMMRGLSISRVTFEKRFQRKVGHPPGVEIRRVRYARARELLADTSLSIGRVAGMVGFDSVQRFGEFFRRQSGTTPSTFRRRARRGEGSGFGVQGSGGGGGEEG